ncbi:MAG: decaprenyl-phosphate phosphoribosyltransferase [Planctomycetaceae bacterium]|nr:decaprenyl-phosphate phosphoribosyltransferase [Planctomycetaceae bacterium]
MSLAEAQTAAAAPANGTAAGIVRLLRPHHWTKNLLCMAGVVFSGQYLQPWAILGAVKTVVVFCAASSAVYVFNDLVDRKRDRLHAHKKARPLASGAVGVPLAVILGLAMGGAALAGSAAMGRSVLVCTALYLLVNLLYTLSLKHAPLLDVLSIAVGFVLRMLAGVYVVRELPTAWIVLCTFFLSLFLALAKRRSELAHRASDDSTQRPVLAHYSLPFLEQMVVSAGVMAVMCYALFTTTSGKNHALMLTVPIVVYGIMSYQSRIMQLPIGQEPEEVLLKDFRIQLCIIAWLASYVAITYFDPQLFR